MAERTTKKPPVGPCGPRRRLLVTLTDGRVLRLMPAQEVYMADTVFTFRRADQLRPGDRIELPRPSYAPNQAEDGTVASVEMEPKCA